MSHDERRYDSEEVARIFEDATEPEQTPSTSTDMTTIVDEGGLTLSELQEIGEEVGLASDLVARAAMRLDGSGVGGIQRGSYGLPTVVRHVQELPGPLSDQGWERLVVHLRTTFDAAGTLSGDGALRTWRNGNLAVFLEPTSDGHRIRMETKSGLIASKMNGGIGFLAGAVGLFSLAGASGEPILTGLAVVLALGGSWLVGSGIRGASKWSALRKSQMETLSEVASGIAAEECPGE